MPRRIRKATPIEQMALFGSQDLNMKLQKGRRMAAATITIDDLLKATKRVPDEEYGIESDNQRPLFKNHCEAIARYILNTEQWIIGPLTFTADSETVEVENAVFKNFNSGFTVLDGQHRIQALHIVKDRLSSDGSTQSQSHLHQILESHIPMTFFANHGKTDASQLFVDLNSGRAVSATERAYLDSRDPVINAIRTMLESETNQWIKDHTDLSRANPERESDDVWSLRLLQSIVRTLHVGFTATLKSSKKQYIATPDGQTECIEMLTGFLNWLPEAREEYMDAKNSIPNAIPDNRTGYYSYDRNFQILLAHTWNMATQNKEDLTKIAERVGSLNLLRQDSTNNLSSNMFDLIDGKRKMLPFKRAPYDKACEQLRGIN